MGIATVLLSGCWLVDEAQFVDSNPKDVRVFPEPVGTIDSILLDGLEIDELRNVRIQLAGPRPHFEGVKWVDIVATGSSLETSYSVFVSLFLPHSNDPLQIGVSFVSAAVDDLAHESLDPEQQYRNSEEHASPLLVPRGPIILEQDGKRLRLNGTFDIPPLMLETSNPLDQNPSPATIEVRGIRVNIDGDLTYRWCNKGGDCYEK